MTTEWDRIRLARTHTPSCDGSYGAPISSPLILATLLQLEAERGYCGACRKPYRLTKDDHTIPSHRMKTGDALPTREELHAFSLTVAELLCDGLPCSHEDEGCHDHEECEAECKGMDYKIHDCSLGPCCSPVDMASDDEHDSLYNIIQAARELVGWPQAVPA